MAKNVLGNLPKTVTKGAQKAIAPTSLATVGGFAGSGIIETTLYSMARGTFGDNSAEGGLTRGQRTARTLAKAGVAIAAAVASMEVRQPHLRAAALGTMAGATWHILNDFGVNV